MNSHGDQASILRRHWNSLKRIYARLSAWMSKLNPAPRTRKGAVIRALIFALAGGLPALVPVIAGRLPRLFVGAMIGAIVAATASP